MTTILDRSTATTLPAEKPGLRGLLREVSRTGREDRRLGRVAALLFLAEVAISFATYLHELRPDGLAFGAAIKPVHGLVTLLAMIAAYRALLTRHYPLWKIDAASFRFTGGALIEFGLAIAAVVIARLWMAAVLGALGVEGAAARTAGIVAVGVVAVAVTVAFLRAQPWLAALAIGRRDFSLRHSWSDTAGMTWAIVASWAITLLPLMIAYSAVEIVAARAAPAGVGHLPIAIVAALLVTAIALFSALLNAAIFRLIAGVQAGGERNADPSHSS